MLRTHHEDAPEITVGDPPARAPGETGAAVAPPGPESELFDFGPDVSAPEDAPIAALPPWMQQAPAPAAHRSDVGPILPSPRRPRPESSPRSSAVTTTQTDGASETRTAHSPSALRPAPTAAGAVAGGRVDRRRRRQPRGLRTPIKAAVTAAVVLCAGVVVLGGLVGAGGATALTGPDADAAAWVLANLDPAATVLATEGVSAALAAGGHARDRLVSYGDAPSDSAVDSRCCGFLIVGAPAAGDPAGGLANGVRAAYDRSLPTATFTGAGRRVEVRQIIEGAPAEIAAAAAAERATLASAGRELVAADRLNLNPAARTLLLAGAADARVVQALVGLTGRHRITVSAFPAGPGEGAADVLRRSVEIDRIDGQPVVAGSDVVRELTSYLSAQVPPYRPAGAVLTARGGAAVLAVTFPAPSPIGLLTPPADNPAR